MTSGQHAVRPLPGVVPPPTAAQMIGWQDVRPLDPSDPEGWRQGLWWLGCHGGAGVSRLAQLVARSHETRLWPNPAAPQRAAVVLVARTNSAGLDGAQLAARQWASGHVPPSVTLLGLVWVADAPGRLPKELEQRRRVISKGVPREWAVPWVEPWRRGHAPAFEELPKDARSMLIEIVTLVRGGSPLGPTTK